jgi:hypothetical protein
MFIRLPQVTRGKGENRRAWPITLQCWIVALKMNGYRYCALRTGYSNIPAIPAQEKGVLFIKRPALCVMSKVIALKDVASDQ